jgi:hypothetical protein
MRNATERDPPPESSLRAQTRSAHAAIRSARRYTLTTFSALGKKVSVHLDGRVGKSSGGPVRARCPGRAAIYGRRG